MEDDGKDVCCILFNVERLCLPSHKARSEYGVLLGKDITLEFRMTCGCFDIDERL